MIYIYDSVKICIISTDKKIKRPKQSQVEILEVMSIVIFVAVIDITSGIFNSLLKHLRRSVEFQQSEECPSIEEEKIYQESLINAMGDYAYALPDYQKVIESIFYKLYKKSLQYVTAGLFYAVFFNIIF